MELHFVKNDFKIFIGENVCITRKTKILKPEFMRDTSEFDLSKNGNIFD